MAGIYGDRSSREIIINNLPVGRGDILAFTPAKAGTRFSDLATPEGCKAEMTYALQ